MSSLPPVPQRVPLIDPNSLMPTPVWADWFQKAFERMGGKVAFTNDEIAADGFVTYERFQDVPTDKLIGRDASGTGKVTSVDVGGGLEFTGSNGIRSSAFTGDVTKAVGSTVQSIPVGSLAFAKMLATDWTNSKSAQGYTKLPNGIYLQWGSTSSVGSGTSVAVIFPVAFPNACFQAVPGILNNSAVATTATGQWGIDTITAAGFNLLNRTSVSQVFNWFAVGY